MNSCFSIKSAELKTRFNPFAPARLRVAFFCTVLLFQVLQGQICDKKATIYFETDQFSIQAAETQKLETLIKMFAQKTDTFMLEAHAFTDSIASVEYNYKLATNRLKTVIAYLKKYSHCHFEIKEKVRGEAQPLGSNATEEGQAKNRRVDIFYWKINNGRITIKGKGGTEIDLKMDYFGPCGVCESNPKMTEAFSNEEAAQKRIALTTTDGDELITGGMMGLELSNCSERSKLEGNKDWPCSDVIIRIPAPYDEDLEIWKAGKQSSTSNLRWVRDEEGQLEYDAKNKCYIMKVTYCPGTGGGGGVDGCAPMVNLDKPRLDTAGLIAVPELVRTKKRTYVRAAARSVRVFGDGKAVASYMWKFNYRGRGSLFFADSGIGKNKVGYVFSGNIDRYEAECDTGQCRKKKECWCFEIPIDDYTKRIYFQKNKKYRLKIPRKYRNYTVKLFIPAADTMLPVTKIRARKYTFKQPLPDTYIVVYGKNADLNNKRGFDAEIDLEHIRTRYSRHKKCYKAKIKRRQLKKAISSNSS